MTIESIINYLFISEQISSSGQPKAEEFSFISELGFNHIINLAMPNSTNAIREEGSLVTELNMTYHHIPVPFEAPKINQLKLFFWLMEFFQGEKVWVHCVVNYRASAFLYLFYRWKGLPEDRSRVTLFPGWKPNAVWRKFMTQKIEKLRDKV